MADFQTLRDKLQALLVHSMIDAVVSDVSEGKVTVVAASTGSGKSMLLPGALADHSDDLVLVLVPRRFLAIDAAYNVAELSESEIGDKVGYALGQMDGESSRRSPQTKLLYCTYGYALSSGFINRAKTIVLDEVHEADEYISLARAILRERKSKNPDLRILEMSATVDAAAQARYWESIAKTSVHTVEGSALACDILHESPILAGDQGRTIEEIAVSMLEQGRKGIVVFRPGVKEVGDTVKELKRQLAALGARDVEVAGIHGGTPSDERRIARRPPAAGGRKIVVGTNVIESGVNLRWLDSGVSDGYRKIPYHRDDTGADALVKEDQPQAGLLQQIGRINRDPKESGFERGLFILHSRKSFDTRMRQNGPAIQRQSLNAISFYAASLGYDPTKLTWDITSQPHRLALPDRFEQARQELMRLSLIREDWSLTPEGKFTQHLPVSPETGAMLWEAKSLDEARMRERQPPRAMRDATIIAAIIESHGLRLDTRKGHKGDQYRTSDLLDGMNAYRAIRKEEVAHPVLDATEAFLDAASADELELVTKQRVLLEGLCAKQNVSLTGFVEVARLSDEIASRLADRDKGIRIDGRAAEDKYDAERYGELQRCILNAHVNHLFMYQNEGLRDLLRDFGKQRSEAGHPFNGYQVSDRSIVPTPKDGALLVGHLREVSSKKAEQGPQLLLTDASVIPSDVFILWAANRAAHHQIILTHTTLASTGELNATYAGKTTFELSVSPHMRELVRKMNGDTV